MSQIGKTIGIKWLTQKKVGNRPKSTVLEGPRHLEVAWSVGKLARAVELMADVELMPCWGPPRHLAVVLFMRKVRVHHATSRWPCPACSMQVLESMQGPTMPPQGGLVLQLTKPSVKA
ncbi:hypothetical protein V6N13_108100 [Hibiscus sabdariffa]|uniref:Uncharacterized protein n=1 Tax=Hibiscus sabdariffa TaxID=183260 RepID=A0ABR2SRX8_9ROSI